MYNSMALFMDTGLGFRLLEHVNLIIPQGICKPSKCLLPGFGVPM
jgi:hypothetical protein